MKIQLLVAANDKDYTDHLSQVLSEKHESFEVTVCSLPERLKDLLQTQGFDVALIDSALLPLIDISRIKLPLLLWDGMSDNNNSYGLDQIRKYQRVSRISSDILAGYSKIATSNIGLPKNKGKVTVVWSPSGGSGKTTAALAYAAKISSAGSEVIYLDLEFFSSTPVYFSESGKSISTIFQGLSGNVALLLKAIALKDKGSGITYFSCPDNYDDINELNVYDIETLISAAEDISGELVVDLPSICDEKFRSVIEKADNIFIVTDGSKTSMAKLHQFVAQYNLFDKIRARTTLIANKNAKYTGDSFSKTVNFPLVSSNDPISVYKTLSGVNFE